MLLNKDAFEQALQQDMQSLGSVVNTDPSKATNKKDLFGPQTDLTTGLPLVLE